MNTHAKKTTESNEARNDVIFIAALILVFCLIGLWFMLSGKEGDTVTVTVDKSIFGEYPLNEDRTVEIRSADAWNILIIKDGRAAVESASCPDGLCSAHRAISRDGESIICLPNKVVIFVSANSENEPDIIA